MKKTMTIGELAARSDVPDSAIRYYEREGLIRPAGRTPGNYRIYGPDAVTRLRFIRSAQASGLSLADVRALLDCREGERASCGGVRAVIEERLRQVNEQMKHLRHVQRVLEQFREECEKTASDAVCPVLDELDGTGA